MLEEEFINYIFDSMKNVLFLLLMLFCIGACTSKEEKEKQAAERAKIERERFYNDSIVADSLRRENERKRLEEEQLDSIPKAETAKTIKDLSRYFTFKKDEFSIDDRVWVEPKDKPLYIDVNAIFCYFQTNNNKASNLRLKIQYTADDWLFIRSYKFSIDGMAFDYRPDDIKRDNSSNIWEWADNQITAFDQSLITALMMAKSAKIRYVGEQYHKDRNITSQQLLSIKRTVQLYRAMGGTIN